jgi:cell division protein FtsB
MKINISNNIIKRVLINKYSVLLVIFIVIISFFDKHNLIKRWQIESKNRELKKEIQFYQNEIQTTKSLMYELQSDNEHLEKFAREHYLMKRKDEDIYIIKE